MRIWWVWAKKTWKFIDFVKIFCWSNFLQPCCPIWLVATRAWVSIVLRGVSIDLFTKIIKISDFEVLRSRFYIFDVNYCLSIFAKIDNLFFLQFFLRLNAMDDGVLETRLESWNAWLFTDNCKHNGRRNHHHRHENEIRLFGMMLRHHQLYDQAENLIQNQDFGRRKISIENWNFEAKM